MTDNTSPQMDFFGPPKLAERILSLLLTPEDAETVLGDFAEICSQQNSQRQANSWYWGETFHSAPALLQLKLSRQFERSFTVMNKNMKLHNKNFLWISLVALIPALNLRFERGSDGLTSVITFKPVIIHWAVIGMSLLMVAIITIYVFFENFGPI